MICLSFVANGTRKEEKTGREDQMRGKRERWQNKGFSSDFDIDDKKNVQILVHNL